MTKHTPGPWFFRDVRDDAGKRLALILETKHRPVSANDPAIFALREDWLGAQSPEREADRRLIAAAPDMLAALMLARDLIEKIYPCEHAYDAEIAIHAAISKAKGD